MATIKKSDKKYFTVAEANAALPLLRTILRDITALASSLRQRHERLIRLQSAGTLDEAHREEIQQIVAEFESDQQRMEGYEKELRSLNVELKDHFSGLVDFRSWMNGREVYLCWRLGEAEVGHWHDLDAGVAGRQKLTRVGAELGPRASDN